MKLVIVLSFLTSACALRHNHAYSREVTQFGSVGIFSLRCWASRKNVWALRLSFRNASNSFEILRRLDGTPAILLDSNGYPSRFEKSVNYSGVEINAIDGGFELKMYFLYPTTRATATCRELRFGDSEGERWTHSIVPRRPSVVLMQVQPDSSSTKAARITSVPAGSRLKLECRADLGSPPVSRNDLSFQIRRSSFSELRGTSFLRTSIEQCEESVAPSLPIFCQWTVTTRKSMNRSSVACVVRDKKREKSYRSEETELLIYESVSLEIKVKICACHHVVELYLMKFDVKAPPKVKDVTSKLIEKMEKELEFDADCNVTKWRFQQNIGYFMRTDVKVIEMEQYGKAVFFNLDGDLVTRNLSHILNGLRPYVLRPNDNFFYVKDFFNVVSMTAWPQEYRRKGDTEEAGMVNCVYQP